MAIQMSVTQSGGKLHVYADNSSGDHLAVIDNIILRVDFDHGGSWLTWHYSDEFYFPSGRIGAGVAGLMFEMNYSSGPAQAHATAEYWEVDQRVKSPPINIS
jgi:hypothetical protein